MLVVIGPKCNMVVIAAKHSPLKLMIFKIMTFSVVAWETAHTKNKAPVPLQCPQQSDQSSPLWSAAVPQRGLASPWPEEPLGPDRTSPVSTRLQIFPQSLVRLRLCAWAAPPWESCVSSHLTSKGKICVFISSTRKQQKHKSQRMISTVGAETTDHFLTGHIRVGDVFYRHLQDRSWALWLVQGMKSEYLCFMLL